MPTTTKTIASYAVSALLLMTLSSASAAFCKRPSTPDIPDAELANNSEINQASRDVNAYLDQMSKYLRCEKSQSRVTVAERKMRQVVKQYNTMIEEYKVILAEYNKQKNQAPIVTAAITQ